MKIVNYSKFLSLIILIMMSFNTTANDKKDIEVKEKNWIKNIDENLSLTIKGSLSSNFYKPESTNKSFDSSFLLYPRYKFSKLVTGFIYLTADKELINYREDDWG